MNSFAMAELALMCSIVRLRCLLSREERESLIKPIFLLRTSFLDADDCEKDTNKNKKALPLEKRYSLF
jgi:hypothetical protein